MENNMETTLWGFGFDFVSSPLLFPTPSGDLPVAQRYVVLI